MIPDMACRMRTFSEEFGGQCPIRLDRRHLHEFSSDISALGVSSHVMGLEDLQTSRLRGEHGSHWWVSAPFLLDGGWLSFWENKCACVEGDSHWPATVGVCSDTLNSFFQNVSLLGFPWFIPQDRHMNTFCQKRAQKHYPPVPYQLCGNCFYTQQRAVVRKVTS